MKQILALLITTASLNLFAQVDAPAETPAEKSLTTTVVNDEKENLLADAKGNTLYIFDLDQGKPTSVCNAACAEVWPPYLITAEEAANLKAPLGSAVRDNKKVQLTHEGRPVYAYAFDRSVGDDAGDGVGDVWHYIEIETK